MDGIEVFRERLHLAIEGGNVLEVLEISQLLDCEIINYMRCVMNDKMANENFYRKE